MSCNLCKKTRAYLPSAIRARLEVVERRMAQRKDGKASQPQPVKRNEQGA